MDVQQARLLLWLVRDGRLTVGEAEQSAYAPSPSPSIEDLIDRLVDSGRFCRADLVLPADLQPCNPGARTVILATPGTGPRPAGTPISPTIFPPSDDADEPVPGQPWGPFHVEYGRWEGGQGKVYRASKGDRQVALKLFKDSADPDAPLAYQREWEALGSLTHPHIVPGIEVGEHNGQHYLAMEFVTGEPLSETLARMGRLPVDAAVRLVAQVCTAVTCAHAHKVIHRDIKPSNILLAIGRPEPTEVHPDIERVRHAFPRIPPLPIREETTDRYWPLLSDFGLARSSQSDDRSRTFAKSGWPFGTCEYMSPEAAQGDRERVRERSDVFSLGAALYHLVTGQVAFPGGFPERVIWRTIRE